MIVLFGLSNNIGSTTHSTQGRAPAVQMMLAPFEAELANLLTELTVRQEIIDTGSNFVTYDALLSQVIGSDTVLE